MQTAERTAADLLEPPPRALPEKKRLDDLELVPTPERRRLMPLTVTSIDGGA